MLSLQVQKLDPRAQLPTVAHPGEDLGFDIYCLEDVVLLPNLPQLISTGIAAAFTADAWDAQVIMRQLNALPSLMGANKTDAYPPPAYGLELRDRSSMARQGLHVLAGIIDAGYRGEIKVCMVLVSPAPFDATPHHIKAGSKIAQMLPRRVLTDAPVVEVTSLPVAARGDKGFGSSGV